MGVKVTDREKLRKLELENAKLKSENKMYKSQLDYIAMMTGIEIEQLDNGKEGTQHEKR